jgi:hypothetical protein
MRLGDGHGGLPVSAAQRVAWPLRARAHPPSHAHTALHLLPPLSLPPLQHNNTVGEALRLLAAARILSAPVVVSSGLEDFENGGLPPGEAAPSLLGWLVRWAGGAGAAWHDVGPTPRLALVKQALGSAATAMPPLAMPPLA